MIKNLLSAFAFVILGTSLSFAQPMSGTYTINPALPAGGGNYQSFNAVATQLNIFGVVGAVTVNVEPGLYTDTLFLGNVIGTTPLNTITFQRKPGATAAVTLTSASNTITTSTIRLIDTKYITFRNLTVEGTGASYQRLVILDGTLANVAFRNCTFNGKLGASGSTSWTHIYASGSNVIGAGLTVDSCQMNNGSIPLYLVGSSTLRTTNVTVTNNNFNDYSYYGVYATYTDNLFVRKNNFTTTSTSTSYTIYSTNATGSAANRAEILNNNIDVTASSTFYGVYLSYFNSALNPSLIANNFFHNKSTGSTSIRYGVYLTACNGVDVLHNTIKINDGSTTTSRAIYLTSATPTGYTPGNYRICNNIIINNSTSTSATAGNLYYATSTAWAYVTQISNNIYQAANATFPFYNGSSFTDYPSWKTATNDTNSYVGDPQFVSATDLHVVGVLAHDKGLNFASVTTDFDGDARPLAPTNTVEIGADEFVLAACPRPAALTILSNDTNNVTAEWVSGPLSTSWVLEYGPEGFIPGTGTKVGVSTNPATVTGLTKNQFYEMYVYAVCGTDTSDAEGPTSFHSYDQGIYYEVDNTCLPGGFKDISLTGIQNPLLSDATTGFSLPFPLLLQGQKVDKITISNNGVVLFNTVSGTVSPFNGNTINTTALPGAYLFWDDLEDAGGMVYWEAIGTAPNRQFIIQYSKKHDAFTSGTPYSFQMIFEETTMNIYYVYNNVVVGSTTYDYGGSATVGLVSPGGARFPLSYINQSYLTNNQCVRFRHTSCSSINSLAIDYVNPDNLQLSWQAGASGAANGYEIIYDTAGFDLNTSGTSLTTTDLFVIIPNLQEKTTYDFYVRALCSGTQKGEWTKVTVTTLSFCSTPDNIALGVAVDSLMTSWAHTATPGYPLTGFELAYGWRDYDNANGFSTRKLKGPVYTDTTYDVNFVGGGIYDFYIRAVCGTNSSTFVGPFPFKMPLTNDNICDAETLLVNDSTYHFNNTGATVESGEAAIAPPLTGARRTDGWANTAIARTTWFQFTAPASGSVRIDATERLYNGQAAVYSGDCNFSSLVLIGANDDDVDGDSFMPNFTLCGLVPNQDYYLMFDGFTTLVGNYSIKIRELDLSAGVPNGAMVACEGSMVNLFDGLSNSEKGGDWSDQNNSFVLVNDSIFNTSNILAGNYLFNYGIVDGCASDTAEVMVTVFNKNKAGQGQMVTICKNESFNLFQGLTGNVDLNGTWISSNNDTIESGFIKLRQIPVPGSYIFTYDVDNGVCPKESSTVQVVVQSNCDALSIDELSSSNIRVYPNPTKDYFTIQADKGISLDNMEFDIYDAQGKLLNIKAEKTGVSAFSFDVRELPNGLYLLRVIAADGAVLYHSSVSKN
ncbi:MAG: fibronectin type III domain-containing protein [Bacteroidetes bacterium]|nr:fibronectin type III domain-containing protein [Bacteroidota bacterium]